MISVYTVVIVISLLSAAYSDTVNNHTTINKTTSTTLLNENKTVNITHIDINKIKSIPTEFGSINVTNPVNNKTEPVNNSNNNTTTTTKEDTKINVNATKINADVHRPRENVIAEKAPEIKLQNNILNNSTANNNTHVKVDSTNDEPNVLSDDKSSEKKDHKNSKPRKGAVFVETNTTNITHSTSTTIRPKKPTVTIGGDDSSLSSKDNLSNIDSITVNSHKSSSNFIVPIVAVILSVPLVAIIISVLYKRGTEWWQHRHYSRMDFLIDGMYNS